MRFTAGEALSQSESEGILAKGSEGWKKIKKKISQICKNSPGYI